VEADSDALRFLAVMCDGDARRALTALEVGVLSQAAGQPGGRIKFNLEVARESIQRKAIEYDGSGDTHYDLASALQKSMRGSDPDATVYWLARMIAGGEDTRFIARRIAICAAEDVGNADPMATVLAAAAVELSEFVGLPEAQLALAQAALYVACAPKSNASANAIWQAMKCDLAGDEGRDGKAHGAGAQAPEGQSLCGCEEGWYRGGLPVSSRVRGRICGAGLPS